LLGAFPVIAGIAGAAIAGSPDILIGESGRMIAVKQPDGGLAFAARARGFVAETWLRRAGVTLPPTTGKALPVPLWAAERCDTLGCIIRLKGEVVAVTQHAAALRDDCAAASIVLSRVPVRRGQCRGPKIVIDRFDLWRSGAHALWLDPGGVRVESVGSVDGGRPWSRHPPRRSRAR
jgi:competence protein ComEC